MLRGKTICEGADVSKHKRICFAGAVQARSTQFLADDRVMFSMFILLLGTTDFQCSLQQGKFG